MTFKTSFSKMLSYFAKCDPYSYYVPYPTEESENQANAKNDTRS
ncbi:hypothetical protein SAMN02746098_05004 [Desulfosporosinus lacus DSM 15449]|uniref:Uncharacterized protein n=1 Tax=Desulfosporosinus lacus DSM 15449 TaxID=1121420 RepID=A0A1M6FUL1_9FIRM|nr:hypothetical protein SAMN02746098_05004 [Desulfosporosinus lacus DSM 15449]